jgi:hypothetical protein
MVRTKQSREIPIKGHDMTTPAALGVSLDNAVREVATAQQKAKSSFRRWSIRVHVAAVDDILDRRGDLIVAVVVGSLQHPGQLAQDDRP